MHRGRPDHRLRPEEERAYRADGFFVRERAFAGAELAELRGAAERVVTRAEDGVGVPRDRYAIDGNEYVEADVGRHASTVQLEHARGSSTIRVINRVSNRSASRSARKRSMPKRRWMALAARKPRRNRRLSRAASR